MQKINPTDHRSDFTPVLKAPILAIILFLVCALFLRSFAAMRLEESGLPPLVAKDLSWLLVPVILAMLMAPIIKSNWDVLKSQFRVDHLTLRLVLVSIALGLTLRLAYWGWLITNASFQILSSPGPEDIAGPQVSFSCPDTYILLLTTVVMVLLTPIVEEIINRGYCLQSLLAKGRWFAIVGSSILFAVYHQVPSMIPAFIFGLFAAVQFLGVRSLWAPTISHATYNAMSVLDWSCMHLVWNPNAPMVRIGAASFVLLLLFLGLAVMLIKPRWYGIEPRRPGRPDSATC